MDTAPRETQPVVVGGPVPWQKAPADVVRGPPPPHPRLCLCVSGVGDECDNCPLVFNPKQVRPCRGLEFPMGCDSMRCARIERLV